MKKVMVVLLSLVLLLGAVLPVGADAAAQTTPCAPGEHKAYKNIFAFINDAEHPFSYAESEDVYHSSIERGNYDATATLRIIEEGTLVVDVYAFAGAYYCYGKVAHNGRVVASLNNEPSRKSVTISAKAGDTVTVTCENRAEYGGNFRFRVSGAVLAAADDVEPTCTKNVVCDLCGTVVKDVSPHTYYDALDADCNVCGEVREVTYTGWIVRYGAWYYYQNGAKLTKTWKKDSVGWVYLGVGGDMLTKTWVKDSVGWCYVGADGYCVTNQWVKDRTGWRYVGADGRMLVNAWVKDSVGWCYVGANGYCVTNRWVKDSVGWCYLGADGRMLVNAWVQDANGWCYVGSDGRAVTDTWVRDSVGWCYLNSSCNVAKGEWVQTNGKWYFVDIYGYMVTGKQYIDGNWYYFDALTGALAE